MKSMEFNASRRLFANPVMGNPKSFEEKHLIGPNDLFFKPSKPEFHLSTDTYVPTQSLPTSQKTELTFGYNCDTLPKRKKPPTKFSKSIWGLNKPKALEPGDTIAIVAPATPVSYETTKLYIDYFKGLGYKVANYSKSHKFNFHYLSDTDAGRAKSFNAAFANPKVKAVFSIQGGGGSFRPGFLDKLDWKMLKKNPKIFTGFSDITFLHHALYTKANMMTFHSGIPSEGGPTARNAKSIWEMFNPLSVNDTPETIYAGKDYRCYSPGEVTGPIVGGNLSLLSTTMGTPYEIPLTGKEILFIEEWNDDYESIDRLFSHLVHLGLWDKIGGLILGEFHYVPKRKGEYGLTWKQFVSGILKEGKKRGIPIGFNFPVGHGNNNRPIPLGAHVTFNSKAGTLAFLESPVQAIKASS
ncbi:MAG: LD-carboxypeptidase [Cyanobacteria bacterium]|nr:LD-carboxypeptidase [Cyanobacteriota bacterium]